MIDHCFVYSASPSVGRLRMPCERRSCWWGESVTRGSSMDVCVCGGGGLVRRTWLRRLTLSLLSGTAAYMSARSLVFLLVRSPLRD